MTKHVQEICVCPLLWQRISEVLVDLSPQSLSTATVCCRWMPRDLRAATHAVIQAAAVLHSNGLVHCDLRADNILWDQDKPFLTDLEQVHKAGFEVLLRHPLYSLIRQSHISNTSSRISHVDPAARALPPNCFIVA